MSSTWNEEEGTRECPHCEATYRVTVTRYPCKDNDSVTCKVCGGDISWNSTFSPSNWRLIEKQDGGEALQPDNIMAKHAIQGYKAEAHLGDDGKPQQVEVFVSRHNDMEIHLSCKTGDKIKGYPVRLRIRRRDAMRLAEKIISHLGDIWESDEAENA